MVFGLLMPLATHVAGVDLGTSWVENENCQALAAAGTSAAQDRHSPPALYCQLAQF